ncbi:MAG: hypothetical protein AAGA84_11690 [Pseudomonadota bacterium]
MNSLTRLIGTGVLILVGTGCGQSTGGMGALEDIITAEQGQTWTVAPNNGGWNLTNEHANGAIRYYYVDEAPGTGGSREISVDVAVTGDAYSMAGLLYGFRDQPRSYYLYTLAGDQSVHLYHYSNGEMSQKMQLGLDGLGDQVTLGLVEHGQEIALLVNGEERSRIGNNSIGSGGVGVVAVNTGEYDLHNFTLNAQRTQTSTAERAPTERAQRPSRPPSQVAFDGHRDNAHDQPASNQPARNLPADGLRLKRVSVQDSNNPNGAGLAFSTLIPHDWQTQGGVDWSTAYGCMKGPKVVWSAHSPDKQHAVTMLPTYNWSWSTYGGAQTGCVNAQIQDAEHAVRFLLSNMPDIKSEILDVQRPAELKPFLDAMQQQIRNIGAIGQHWADMVVVTVRADDGEVKSDSYLIAMTTHWQNSTPDGWGAGGTLDAGGGHLAFLLALSTEQGKLDEGHPGIPTVMNNFKWDPKWQQRTNAWWLEEHRKAGREIKKMADMSSITAKTNSSILDSMHDSYMKRDAMRDRGHAESVEAVWGTETYSTSQGDLSFSNAYDQTWELANGEFFQTNDAFYQPLTDSDMDGRLLQTSR